MPITGKSTVSLIAKMSSLVFARIPTAPPSYAANAIFDIIKDECNGSSGSAWQDTINPCGNIIPHSISRFFT